MWSTVRTYTKQCIAEIEVIRVHLQVIEEVVGVGL